MAKALEDCVRLLSRLPGLGPRSARRVVLHLLDRRDTLLADLLTSLQTTRDTIHPCPVCGFLDDRSPCTYCSDARRRTDQICVVAGQSDVLAVEKTRLYQGQYHLLGGVISALDGIRPDQLRIAELLDRAQKLEAVELILALPSTVDGQTTASYLTSLFKDAPSVKISRLAQGVPMGGELDYLDGATLAAALKNRN